MKEMKEMERRRGRQKMLAHNHSKIDFFTNKKNYFKERQSAETECRDSCHAAMIANI